MTSCMAVPTKNRIASKIKQINFKKKSIADSAHILKGKNWCIRICIDKPTKKRLVESIMQNFVGGNIDFTKIRKFKNVGSEA